MKVLKVESSRGGEPVIIHCSNDGGSEEGRDRRMQREAAGYLAGQFVGGRYESAVVVMLGPDDKYLLGAGSTCESKSQVEAAALTRLERMEPDARVEMWATVPAGDVFTVTAAEMSAEEVAGQ